MSKDTYQIAALTRELSQFATMIVADDNELFFKRLSSELPISLLTFQSGAVHNGWIIPQKWTVKRAKILVNGEVVFDGKSHTLGVAMYSRSFSGRVSYQELQSHVVSHKKIPAAHVFHCMWQYRPWQADWAFCIPTATWSTFSKDAEFDIELETNLEAGEMIVGEYTHEGTLPKTIVFNAHTCHPHQANDALVGVATLVRLFQWLSGRKTRYTYKLILGPEHLGTVFYLQNRPKSDINQMVGGIYTEMTGTKSSLKAASTFLGNQAIDRVVGHALRHYTKNHIQVAWRRGAGNDETVWEAPGYEVPFVELTRAHSLWEPYPEYHSDFDNVESLDMENVEEAYEVLQHVVNIFEDDRLMYRQFDGIICLSNPEYDLYFERPDPAVSKNLGVDSEKWGYLTDCLLRYFDGSISVLDIAERHSLPFEDLLKYLRRFEEKGLIVFSPVEVERRAASTVRTETIDR